jgi:hypothetical protein
VRIFIAKRPNQNGSKGQDTSTKQKKATTKQAKTKAGEEQKSITQQRKRNHKELNSNRYNRSG